MSVTTFAERPGAVYLLPHRNRERFKVGWSAPPMMRVQRLPEYRDHQLDLRGAEVAWFDHARRAREAERVIHRSLWPYRSAAAHLGSGFTEWFGIQGLACARRVVSMLPTCEGGSDRARLRPLNSRADPKCWTGIVPMEETALDAWLRMEDLWLRVAAIVPLQSSVDGERRRLVALHFKRAHDAGAEILRIRVANPDSHAWFEQDLRRSLVTMLDWEGANLVADLMPARQLHCWSDGEIVDGMLREFLARRTTRLITAARRAPAPTG